jgi:RNA polymerase sigma-70 factor, ECF subfamily
MTRRPPSPAPGAEHATPGDEPGLVERVKAGDPAAFEVLVRRYTRRAVAIAHRLLGHREDAEDLVQEAFLQALRRIDQIEPGRSFGPWFFCLLTNRGLNARKARAVRRTEQLPEDGVTTITSPHAAAERAELRGRLREALDTLPERRRKIVELFEIEGFSSAEIAEIMGMTDGAVRWHMHQARRALRRALAQLRAAMG